CPTRRSSDLVELSRDVHCEAAVPVLRVDLLDPAGRACDPGIVDEAVEAAELLEGFLEHGCHLVTVSDIAHAPGQLRVRLGQGLERRLVDIAHVHPGPLPHECAGNLETNTCGSGGNQYAQTFDLHIHDALSRL